MKIPTAKSEPDRTMEEYLRRRDPASRERLILAHQWLVRALAARFAGSGEPLEDLVQVGNVGLIRALDRFDPCHGTRFTTFATPTILGEIKRHFRDRTRLLKVPRWLQELHQEVRRTALRMTAELGRPPDITEIATRLGVAEEAVLEAMAAGESAQVFSLDASLPGDGGETSTLSEVVGGADASLLSAERDLDLRNALASLSPRERQVILLRFYREMSQAKIARQMNVSQMHISRLERRALERLRCRLAAALPEAASPAGR